MINTLVYKLYIFYLQQQHSRIFPVKSDNNISLIIIMCKGNHQKVFKRRKNVNMQLMDDVLVPSTYLAYQCTCTCIYKLSLFSRLPHLSPGVLVINSRLHVLPVFHEEL